MKTLKKIQSIITFLLLLILTISCSDSASENIEDANDDGIKIEWPKENDNKQPFTITDSSIVQYESYIKADKVYTNFPRKQVVLVDNGLQIHMGDSEQQSKGYYSNFGQKIEKVIISITRIEALHNKYGWIKISDKLQKVDLLSLIDGKTSLIFNKPFTIGKYSDVRLILNYENEIVADEKSYHLFIPGARLFGIQLIKPFTITESKIVKLILDFNVKKSVICIGKGRFLLIPVIKIADVVELDGGGIVTTTGGNVSTVDGNVNLEVPENAVNQTIQMSIDEIDTNKLPIHDLPNSKYEYSFIGDAYDFKPDDINFSKEVKLSIKYDPSKLSSINVQPDKIGLYRLDETSNNWIKIPAVVSLADNTITANISHFSIYAPFEEKDWDWTINKNYPFCMYYNNQLQVITEENKLPYYSGYGPAYNAFGISTDKMDFQQKDGWVQIAKDFGHVDGFGNPLRAPRSYPFFILYNRPRGVFRLFYYYPDVERPFTKAKVTLSHLTGKSTYLTYENTTYSALNNYEVNSNNSCSVITELQKGAWNYADFVLAGFDPNISDNDHIDSNFRILIEGMEISGGSIGLIGSISLEQVMGNASLRTIGFNNILSAGQEAWGYYNSSASASAWLAAQLGVSGSGLQILSGYAGFMKSMIFGGSKKPTPLKLAGDIVMNGDIQLETLYNIGDIVIGIPGALRSSGDNVMYGSLFDNSLGIFILNEGPIPMIGRFIDKGCYCQVNGFYILRFQTEVGLKKSIDITLNPMLNNDVSGYKYKVTSIEAAYVWEDKILNKSNTGNFIDIAQFNSQKNFYSGQKLNIVTGVNNVYDTIDNVYGKHWEKTGNSSHCNITLDMTPWMRNFPQIAIRITVDRDPHTDDFEPVTFVKTYPVKYQTP